MALFDIYRPYLYDNLSEGERKQVGLNIFANLTMKVMENSIDSAEVYLGSFTKGDIGFIYDLFKLNNLVNDNVYNKEVSFSPEILEEVVAFASLNNLWCQIKEKYKTKNEIYESLVAKPNIVTELKYNGKEANQELLDYLNIYKELGFSIENKEDIVGATNDFRNLMSLFKAMNTDIVNEEVVQAANKIVSSLRILYKNLFNNNYVCIVLPGGVPIFPNVVKSNAFGGKIKELSSYLTGITNVWYNIANVDINKISYKSSNIEIEEKSYVFSKETNLLEPFEYSSFPKMHKTFLNNSSKEFESILDGIKEDIINYLSVKRKEESENYHLYYESLRKQFLSCIIVTEVNNHTMQWRVPLIENAEDCLSNINSELSNQIVGAEKLKLLSNYVDRKEDTIHNFTVIYSDSKFQQEVLFAHTLYEGANCQTPDIENPILGRKLDGSLMQKNVFGETYTTILAGARSGKGTLTMSLLAPLIAEGASIIYLDNKPDIASLFWDLEKKYSEKGKDLHFLAIDGNDQKSSFIKGEISVNPRGIVKDETGKITNLKNAPKGYTVSDLKLIRYYKFLQLLFIAGRLQADERITGLDAIQNYVFLDEVTKLSNRINTYLGQINRIGKLDKNSDEYIWTYKLATIMKDVMDDFKDLKLMPQTQHNFKFILIGQTYNSSKRKDWGAAPDNTVAFDDIQLGKFTETFIYDCMGKCTNWLSGREQVSKDMFKLKSDAEYQMADKTGIFVHHTSPIVIGTKSDAGSTYISDGELFRSYFALVRNDIGKFKPEIDKSIKEGKFVTFLTENEKNGYTNQFLKNRDKFYKDAEVSLDSLFDKRLNQPIKGVGFDGLFEQISELLGKDIYSDEFVERLNRPYDRLLWVLEKAGILNEFGYKYIEQYLYDCSADSFFSKEEIERRFWEGYNNNGIYIKNDNETVQYQSDSPETLRLFDNVDKKAEEQKESILSDDSISEEEKKEAISQIDIETENQKKGIAEEEFNKKVMALYNRYTSDFNTNINKIRTKKRELENIPREEKKRANFVKLQGEVLDNFNGTYAKDRQKFFDTLSKDTSEALIKEAVIKKYQEDYDSILNTLKSEIENMDFTVSVSNDSEKEKEQEHNGGSSEKKKDAELDDYTPPEKKSKLNGRTVDTNLSDESKGLVYNIDNTDSWDNVKASSHLTQIVIKDIKKQFGGLNGIETISVTANGCLAINGYTYSPKFDESFMDSLGAAIRHDVEDGQLYKVVNIGRVINAISANIYELSIETPKVSCNDVFKKEMGIKGDNYSVLFRTHNNLQTIYLPDDELTRNNPHQQQGSGGGLGSKLARIFGFGGNRNSENYTPNPAPSYEGNDMVDRIFDSKPVRVLTGALGWTLGCKAVVLAATMFGPWGLVFGAFAAVGAYNSMKEDRNNYSSSNRGSNGNYSGNSGNGSKSGSKGKNGSQGKNNKNKWN